MPRKRLGHTTSVTIGGERFTLTANGGADGRLGEVFLTCGKQGHTVTGLMDAYATALTEGLQRGFPLIDLVRQGLDMHFTPCGHTDDPDFPRVRSVVDWAARRLAADWLPFDIRAAEGILTLSERVNAAQDWLASHDPQIAPADGASHRIDDFRADLAGGIGVPARPHT
ncbi:hypothetical protein Acsp03_71680 [Actinomadura sp. NBRC 104412]|uniref:TSCPD domain-containing protein n=1 Tax=Actinomadura sp. NBRC 104412 TaxID=3032203 RepID=UPI0024A1435E|nr:hypothetical protein [Actinomadura sp. NBRC 104412]GLZ09702.1 hypothetical protein Acsp03_71680 [Actinomadura sp. NBRC 104412]